MKALLLVLIFLAPFAWGTPPFKQAVSAPQAGEYYSSGSFRADLNSSSTRAALGDLPTDRQARQKFQYALTRQGSDPKFSGMAPEKKFIEVSKLPEGIAPQARAGTTLPQNKLGWDEKLYDAVRLNDLAAEGTEVEAYNLGPGYLYVDQLKASNPKLAKEIEDKLNAARNERLFNSRTFRETADDAMQGVHKLTRDSHLGDPQSPKVAAEPVKGGKLLGADPFSQASVYERKVDKVVDSLSDSTLDFLRENGISARDYAEAYVDGDFDSEEGREDFFSRYGDTNGFNEDGTRTRAKALSQSAKEYLDNLREMLDNDSDPEDRLAPSGRGVAGEILSPQTLVMSDMAKARNNAADEGEKRALLNFVEDWWKHTTGKKVDPKVRAAHTRGDGPSNSGGPPRQTTIFDIAGQAYRRATQS